MSGVLSPSHPRHLVVYGNTTGTEYFKIIIFFFSISFLRNDLGFTNKKIANIFRFKLRTRKLFEKLDGEKKIPKIDDL